MSSTTLASTLVRSQSLVREVALMVAGVAIIGIAAQIVVPLSFTPVPITGQTLGVLLIGGAYGARRGGITSLAYVALGCAGLPVFASGSSGFEVLLSATGGYLIGMPLAAGVVGWASEHGWDRRLRSSLIAMVAGNVVIYLVGASWLAVALGVGAGTAISLGVVPFVLGDVIKIGVVGSLLPAAWRAVAWVHRDD